MNTPDASLNLSRLDHITVLCHTANHARRYFERTVLGPTRLTWTSYEVLHLAVTHTPIDTGALATIAGLSKGTVTRAARTLIGRGLLHRHTPQSDHRRAVLAPTAQGWALNLTLRGQLIAELARLLDPPSPSGTSEFAHLRHLLANPGQIAATDRTEPLT
jgi:DNA-binding MarR family transcriptional regulator